MLAATAAAVVLAALAPHAPVVNVVDGQPMTEAVLARPTGYVLMAPVSIVLDTLTLMTVRQHITFGVTLVILFALWWWRTGLAVSAPVLPSRVAVRIVARLGLALLALFSLYLAVAVLPRPMAALETSANVLAVDVHAHTRHSHDGRSDWQTEDVRRWHRDAGFGAAFITDHRTFEGAREGWANNPALAGRNTVLLPGIEVVWKGEHINILDADRFYQGLLNATLRDVDDEALRLASTLPGNEPVLIETIPGDPFKPIYASGPGTAGARAIEISDGAPRGLAQTRRQRAALIRLADSLDLALVAGSDHHGWGKTAAAWTLFYIPGWRGATPTDLAEAITVFLRRGGRASTMVVERWIPNTESGIALPFTVPVVGWGMLRTLSTAERVSWLAWTAALYALWRVRESRRRRLA